MELNIILFLAIIAVAQGKPIEENLYTKPPPVSSTPSAIPPSTTNVSGNLGGNQPFEIVISSASPSVSGVLNNNLQPSIGSSTNITASSVVYKPKLHKVIFEDSVVGKFINVECNASATLIIKKQSDPVQSDFSTSKLASGPNMEMLSSILEDRYNNGTAKSVESNIISTSNEQQPGTGISLSTPATEEFGEMDANNDFTFVEQEEVDPVQSDFSANRLSSLKPNVTASVNTAATDSSPLINETTSTVPSGDNLPSTTEMSANGVDVVTMLYTSSGENLDSNISAVVNISEKFSELGCEQSQSNSLSCNQTNTTDSSMKVLNSDNVNISQDINMESIIGQVLLGKKNETSIDEELITIVTPSTPVKEDVSDIKGEGSSMLGTVSENAASSVNESEPVTIVWAINPNQTSVLNLTMEEYIAATDSLVSTTPEPLIIVTAVNLIEDPVKSAGTSSFVTNGSHISQSIGSETSIAVSSSGGSTQEQTSNQLSNNADQPSSSNTENELLSNDFGNDFHQMESQIGNQLFSSIGSSSANQHPVSELLSMLITNAANISVLKNVTIQSSSQEKSSSIVKTDSVQTSALASQIQSQSNMGAGPSEDMPIVGGVILEQKSGTLSNSLLNRPVGSQIVSHFPLIEFINRTVIMLSNKVNRTDGEDTDGNMATLTLPEHFSFLNGQEPVVTGTGSSLEVHSQQALTETSVLNDTMLEESGASTNSIKENKPIVAVDGEQSENLFLSEISAFSSSDSAQKPVSTSVASKISLAGFNNSIVINESASTTNHAVLENGAIFNSSVHEFGMDESSTQISIDKKEEVKPILETDVFNNTASDSKPDGDIVGEQKPVAALPEPNTIINQVLNHSHTANSFVSHQLATALVNSTTSQLFDSTTKNNRGVENQTLEDGTTMVAGTIHIQPTREQASVAVASDAPSSAQPVINQMIIDGIGGEDMVIASNVTNSVSVLNAHDVLPEISVTSSLINPLSSSSINETAPSLVAINPQLHNVKNLSDSIAFASGHESATVNSNTMDIQTTDQQVAEQQTIVENSASVSHSHTTGVINSQSFPVLGDSSSAVMVNEQRPLPSHENTVPTEEHAKIVESAGPTRIQIFENGFEVDVNSTHTNKQLNSEETDSVVASFNAQPVLVVNASSPTEKLDSDTKAHILADSAQVAENGETSFEHVLEIMSDGANAARNDTNKTLIENQAHPLVLGDVTPQQPISQIVHGSAAAVAAASDSISSDHSKGAKSHSGTAASSNSGKEKVTETKVESVEKIPFKILVDGEKPQVLISSTSPIMIVISQTNSAGKTSQVYNNCSSSSSDTNFELDGNGNMDSGKTVEKTLVSSNVNTKIGSTVKNVNFAPKVDKQKPATIDKISFNKSELNTLQNFIEEDISSSPKTSVIILPPKNPFFEALIKIKYTNDAPTPNIVIDSNISKPNQRPLIEEIAWTNRKYVIINLKNSQHDGMLPDRETFQPVDTSANSLKAKVNLGRFMSSGVNVANVPVNRRRSAGNTELLMMEPTARK